jgi:phosphopantetheinyl transferase
MEETALWEHSLVDREVHLWQADLDSPTWRGAAGLPREEQARAARLLSPTRRRRWVAARWALRAALAHHLERDPAAIELRQGAGGKPELAGEVGLRFNLSHSHGKGLIAIGGEREVGVDVELIQASRPASFYLEWTRREARAKCLGVGLWAPLPDLPVSVANLDVDEAFAAAVAVRTA